MKGCGIWEDVWICRAAARIRGREEPFSPWVTRFVYMAPPPKIEFHAPKVDQTIKGELTNTDSNRQDKYRYLRPLPPHWLRSLSPSRQGEEERETVQPHTSCSGRTLCHAQEEPYDVTPEPQIPRFTQGRRDNNNHWNTFPDHT